MKNTLDQLVLFLKKELQNNDLGNSKPSRKKVRRKKTSKVSEDAILKDIKASIEKIGCKSLTVGGLYRAFGHKRRGPINTEAILDFLSENKLYCYPPLDFSLSWKDRIEIHSFPKTRGGDLFDQEKKLQEFIATKGLLSELQVSEITPEYSPNHTRDRLDFFAKDGDKNVVIEIKNKGGGKRAVEQVLRYTGMLKQQHPGIPVRKILITGVQDQHTAKAIHGMTEQEKKGFEWYLYIYEQISGNITFEKINYNKFFK